jgi:hypothetical protein
MTSPYARVAALALSVALSTLVVSTAAAETSKSTSAAKWSATLCSTVKSWQDSIDQTIDDVGNQESADTLEGGRSQIEAYVARLVELTDQAKTQVTDAGRPKVPGGAKMVAAFTQAFDTAKSDLAAVQAQAAAIPVDDSTAFIDAAGDIDSAVFDALSPVTDTMSDLNGLDTSGKLLKAFTKQKSCKPFVL